MPVYRLICDTCQCEEDVFRRLAQIDDLLPSCHAAPMRRKVCAPFVQGDQPAYQAIAVDAKTGTAPVIEGRSAHREYLRRNGYVEAADIKPQLRADTRGDFNVRKDLADATRAVLSIPGHVR